MELCVTKAWALRTTRPGAHIAVQASTQWKLKLFLKEIFVVFENTGSADEVLQEAEGILVGG